MAAGRLWSGLGLALGVLAYRPLLGFNGQAGSVGFDGDAFFFGAHALSPWLVLPLALWLSWRRAPTYAALPNRRNTWGLALLAVGMAALAWARLANAPDLLVASLSANLLGATCWQKGLAGARQMSLPALVALLALPIPSPLQHEILWWLQILTTWTSATLLHLAGYAAYGSGTLIRLDDQYFQVIEACSGLRSLLILLLVSILVRELFRHAGTRMWWVVAAAPLVAFTANALRVTVIAMSSPELAPGIPAEQDHTAQGLAVVVAGTAFLYGLGRVLERKSPLPTNETREHPLPRIRPGTAAWLALLGLLSWLPALSPHSVAPPDVIELPEHHAGWVGESLRPDRLYLGSLPLSNIVEMRFTRPARPGDPPVYLFVGYRDPARPRASLRAAKLRMPGREWSPNGAKPERLWVLDQDIERVLAARPNEQAVSYVWHTRPSSLPWETLRSLLALPLEAGATDDVVVRLSTPTVRVGSLARDQAEQRLDAFAKAFRRPLSGL